MVLLNFSAKELTGKIVYYGSGLSGKTTNLQFIYRHLAPKIKGQFISLATDEDRTLFFDFLPIDLGNIRGMRTRFQLYTVPGQVFYNETRRIVLRGADAIVFVADSQVDRFEANIESVENMKENLRCNDINPDTIPMVFQYNKRDLKNLTSEEELNSQLNWRNAPFFCSVATTGRGVMDTFKSIGKVLMLDFTRNYRLQPKLVKSSSPETEEKAAELPKPSLGETDATTRESAPGEASPDDKKEVGKTVAIEEVVLHRQGGSWFSIDGDTLKREEADEALLKNAKADATCSELEISDDSLIAPLPSTPSASPSSEKSVDLKNELDRLQVENQELKSSQKELLEMMNNLREEMKKLQK